MLKRNKARRTEYTKQCSLKTQPSKAKQTAAYAKNSNNTYGAETLIIATKKPQIKLATAPS